MALTYSSKIALGTKAADFTLPDTVSGNIFSLKDVRGEKGTVVMFICNHCPYVKHVNPEIVRVANDYRILGFGFVAISSNDTENYPQDAPDLMWEIARENDYTFPYLYDETQEIAKAYDARCTPDFYVFDAALKLIYHGQLDNSRPENGVPLTGRTLRETLDSVLNNRKVSEIQKPSMGCGIKWKSDTN